MMNANGKNESKTRSRILAAAAELFAARGFHDTTVRDICADAQVNVAAINYHFGSKEKLYEDVWKYVTVRSDTGMLSPAMAENSATPEQQLRRYITSFLSRLLSRKEPPLAAMIMIHETKAPTQLFSTMVETTIKPHFLTLYTIVKKLMEDDAEESAICNCCFSIMGQCLYFRVHQPVVVCLNPRQQFDTQGVKRLTDHITRFSLYAIQQLKQTHNDVSTPSNPGLVL